MCTGPGLVGGPGTCVCGPGLFGTPVFDSTDWTNPCLSTGITIDTSLTMTNTTAQIMNRPDQKAMFAQAVEEGIRQQSGMEAKARNVQASLVTRRRKILSETVDMAYTLVLPAAQGAEQSTFNAVVADLIAAVTNGGIASELASLGTLGTPSFVAPTTYVPVDSATTCVGANVILTPSGECICGYLHLGKPAWDVDASSYTNFTCTLVSCPLGSSGTVAGATGRDGESGCVVSSGYSGKAIRLDVPPWVVSTIQAVMCPPGKAPLFQGKPKTGLVIIGNYRSRRTLQRPENGWGIPRFPCSDSHPTHTSRLDWDCARHQWDGGHVRLRGRHLDAHGHRYGPAVPSVLLIRSLPDIVDLLCFRPVCGRQFLSAVRCWPETKGFYTKANIFSV